MVAERKYKDKMPASARYKILPTKKMVNDEADKSMSIADMEGYEDELMEIPSETRFCQMLTHE